MFGGFRGVMLNDVVRYIPGMWIKMLILFYFDGRKLLTVAYRILLMLMYSILQFSFLSKFQAYCHRPSGIVQSTGLTLRS